MQSLRTVRVMTYLSERSSDDRELLSRMRAMRARGVSYSEQIRRGLRLLHTPERGSESRPADVLRLVELLSQCQDRLDRERSLSLSLRHDYAAAIGMLRLALYGDKSARERAADYLASVDARGV